MLFIRKMVLLRHFQLNTGKLSTKKLAYKFLNHLYTGHHFYDTDSTIASFSLAIASSLLAGINQYAQLRIRG